VLTFCHTGVHDVAVIELTHADISADPAENTATINRSLQFAHDMRGSDLVVLPQGAIEVADGTEFVVDTDYSALLQLRGAGGDDHATRLIATGTGPALTIGTTAGGNFRRAPVRGIAFQVGGIRLIKIGYGVLDDVAFHACQSPAIKAEQSQVVIRNSRAQHCQEVLHGVGGIVEFEGFGFGEDVGGINSYQCHVHLLNCRGHSLKSTDFMRDPAQGGNYGDKPWSYIREARFKMTGGNLELASHDPNSGAVNDIHCDSFIRTNNARDVMISGGATINCGKAASLVNVRGQSGGSEPNAACVIGDAVITSKRDVGDKFTLMRSLSGVNGSGFNSAVVRAVVEATDISETGFSWGDVALAQGLVHHDAQVRLNTD
jgi:hypothetical protein